MSEEKKIAKELVDSFDSGKNSTSASIRAMTSMLSEEHALICVKWIVKEINLHYPFNRLYRKQVLLKWEKVKQEILLRR